MEIQIKNIRNNIMGLVPSLDSYPNPTKEMKFISWWNGGSEGFDNSGLPRFSGSPTNPADLQNQYDLDYVTGYQQVDDVSNENVKDRVGLAIGLDKVVPTKYGVEGNLLREYSNNMFIRTINCSIKGAIGLRSPSNFYVSSNNGCPIPCGESFKLHLSAYDLDNIIPIYSFNELWYKAYYKFFEMDYVFNEFDSDEPINEMIKCAYQFKGGERIAKRYRVGFEGSIIQKYGSPNSTPPNVEKQTMISVHYNEIGINPAYIGKRVSMQIKLNAEYINDLDKDL